MIMLRLSLILFLVISCSDKESNGNTNRAEKTTQSESFKMDNPALFIGISFGHFLQRSHKIGDYEQMLKFTFAETRAKFGDSALLEFYQNMQFSYPISLKTLKWSQEKFTMFYSTNIEATEKTIQIIGVIENDSCKLLLQKLDFEKPFVGM